MKILPYISRTMKKTFACALMIQLFFGCKKDTINVSDIYPTDNVGNPVGSFPNDTQWQAQTYSADEMALFQSMDTANLTGTTVPTISHHYYAYPNPFSNLFNIPIIASQPFNGAFVMKFVVVDKHMKPVHKGSVRLQFNNNTGVSVQIAGNFGAGNYRVYFTYSAEGHEHFFKTWGNIQKIP
jgi:methionine-rich copper-binding protein CopC